MESPCGVFQRVNAGGDLCQLLVLNPVFGFGPECFYALGQRFKLSIVGRLLQLFFDLRQARCQAVDACVGDLLSCFVLQLGKPRV